MPGWGRVAVLAANNKKLRSLQHKLYSVVEEVHRSTGPASKRDLILKSKNKGRRSKVNAGEVCALDYLRRSSAFSKERGATLFSSFF